MREILSTEIMLPIKLMFDEKYEKRKLISMELIQVLSTLSEVSYYKFVTTDTDNILEDTEV
jgi:RNAse (barnase) inhibitor barstar